MNKLKKWISVLLILAVVLGSFSVALAADTGKITDIAGTDYEKAVTRLVELDILSGYPDGTFRPENSVNRGEAAKIAALLLGAEEKDLTAAAAAKFSDVAPDHWAAQYINYMASKGILNGYPNGTFRPSNTVTYNEMAKILVLICGVDPEGLQGVWPENYRNAAADLGLMDGFTLADGNAAATRGHVAIMAYNACEEPEEEAPAVTPPATDTNRLTAYLDTLRRGYVFGVVQETCSLTNKDGTGVPALAFLMGSYGQGEVPAQVSSAAITVISGLTKDDYLNGQLFCLSIRTGEIIDVQTAATWNTTAPDQFLELTVNANIDKNVKGFAAAKEWNAEKGIIIFENSLGYNTAIALADKNVIYKLTEKNGVEAYSLADASALKNKALVRIYDVTDDGEDNGDIVVIDAR